MGVSFYYTLIFKRIAINLIALIFNGSKMNFVQFDNPERLV